MTQVSRAESAGASTQTSRRNAAALHTEAVAGPQVPRRDTKQQDYGAMARQLASDGQWADRVLSPSSPSDASSRPATQIYEADGRSRPRQEMTQHPDEVDPPPAYADVTRVHELPAEPARQADPEDSAQAELAVDSSTTNRRSSSSDSSDSEEENSRSQLLQRRRRRRHKRHGRHCGFRGQWHKSSNSRGQICKAFCFTIVSLALILLVVLRISATKSRTWFGSPRPENPKPTVLPDFPDGGIQRHESSANIEGTFKLYNYVDLSTDTGAIDVVIDPQPGTGPAILKLSSISGSITVHVAPSFLRDDARPIRTFRTFIKTTTGPIYGDVVLGSGGIVKVSTDLGLVLLTIWTTHVGHNNKTSSIHTTSYTGDQSIQVIPLDTTDSVAAIVGNHITKATGSLDVTYPPQWQGKVHAISHGSAAVTMSGNDLNYIRASDKETMAFRGSLPRAKVVSLVSQGSGSIDFRC